MLKRLFFRSETSYLLLILVTIFSKILGFGRESVIAYKFGVSSDLDIFLVLFIVPNMVASLFVYAIPHVIMPKLALDERLSNGEKYYQDFASYFLWPLILFSAVISVIYFTIIPVILNRLLAGIPIENISQIIKMGRILGLYIFFSLIFSILKTLYDAEKKYILPAIATFSIHTFVILSVLVMADSLNIFSMVIGLLSGSIVQVIVLLIDLRKNRKLKFFTIGLKKFSGLTASLIIVVLIEFLGQSYSLIDRSFFSQLPTGYISALNYSGILYNLPVAVFGMTLGVVVFPKLTEAAISNDRHLFKNIFYSSIKKVLILSIPIFLVFFFWNGTIIKILFQRGEFNEEATIITSSMLKFYSLGIPFIMIHVILVKVSLSLKKEILLLLATFVSVIIKYFSLNFFIHIRWYEGLAFSTTLVYFISAIVLIALFLSDREKYSHAIS